MKKSEKLPQVTIGLLTYNYPDWGKREFFLKALNSLIEQDYENKEILIVDDCSKDKIYEDCLSYSKKYDFIQVFQNEKNVGVIENLKKLLTLVKGDLFLWACPDDAYDPTFISKCVGHFMTDPNVALVSTAIKTFYESGEIHIHRYHDFSRGLPFRKIVRNVFQGRDSHGKLVHFPPVIHSSIIRKKYLSETFFEKMFYFAEQLWFLNMLIYGKIAYIDEILYFRYCSDLLHDEKDPQLAVHFRFGINQFKYLTDYIKFFLLKKDLALNKKIKHLLLSLLTLRYYLLTKTWDIFKCKFKCKLVQLIRKFGFMRYSSN